MSERREARPEGEVYDWFRRGSDLLDSGDAAAAAALLAHAAQAEPQSRSIREALGRAQFNAGLYPDAVSSFGALVEADPGDDYAQFALGLALSRTGRQQEALPHLAIASAMRPAARHYADALREARATLRARERRDQGASGGRA